MPRYRFHIHDGIDQPDPDGTELPNIESARTEGLKLAGSIIRDAGLRGALGHDWSVEVTDDQGVLLFRMDFVVTESSAPTKSG